MKSFNFCKLPLVLLGLGGALLFAPQSRAQSEIAPDHFDGTDSWAAAAAARVPTKAQPTMSQVRGNKPAAPGLQPVAAREAVVTRRSSAAAANKKRKAVAPKSGK